MSVDGEVEMPPFMEPITPLEVTPPTQFDESPQLTRRKVVEALKIDLDQLREAQPEVHAIPNGGVAEPGTTPYGTLSRSQSRRGSYLFGMV